MIRSFFMLAGWFLLVVAGIMLALSWSPVLAPVLWTVGAVSILSSLGLLWRHRERATVRSRDRIRRALRWTALALLINLGVTLLMQVVSRQSTIGPLRNDLERMRP